jgi:hypothetical protein
MTPLKRKETQKAFLEAYKSSACNVSISCQKVGISRNTFYEWKKADTEFNQAVTEEEESLLDFAETMLFKAIKEGKTPELIFFLKTKGQKRGYVEKQKIDVSSDRPDLSGLTLDEMKAIVYGDQE